MAVGRLNWLRLCILCLTLVSVSLGLVLRGSVNLSHDLIIIIVSDALAFIMYAVAIYSSRKEDHYRLFGIGLRLAMSIFTLFVPAKALDDCNFGVEPQWSVSRGTFDSEYIRCPGLSVNTHREGELLRPTYHLLRAQCIVAVIVSLLMVLELFSYWWSSEGRGRSREVELGLELAAPIEMDVDVEIENLSYSEQKIEMPGP